MKIRELKAGHVIRIKRDLGYYHFGIYSGGGNVIHYNSGKFLIGEVLETPICEFGFLDDIEIVMYPTSYDFHIEKSLLQGGVVKFLNDFKKNYDYESFSNRKTLSRARKSLGKKWYHPTLNNCEHFVTWCKTGITHSNQLNKMMLGFKYYKIDKEKLPR